MIRLVSARPKQVPIEEALQTSRKIEEEEFDNSTGDDEFEDEEDEEDIEPEPPFRFFDLPAELRIRIYEEVLLMPQTVDLDPSNYYTIARRLRMFETCRQMHEEAYRVFYGRNTFRLFPSAGRFFNTKQPLLARLPRRYRRELTSLELRVGPGWSKPPRCWTLKPRPRVNLRLQDCVQLRQLYLFVEVDPSHDIFKGYRIDGSFYTNFCGTLLREFFDKVPSILSVQLDAYPSVSQRGPLVRELVHTATAAGKIITWGPDSWNYASAPSAGGVQHDMGLEVVEASTVVEATA